MKRIGFHFWRIGIFLFFKDWICCKDLILIPTLGLYVKNGYDIYADLEIKFISFGIGIRFIWIRKRNY